MQFHEKIMLTSYLNVKMNIAAAYIIPCLFYYYTPGILNSLSVLNAHYYTYF